MAALLAALMFPAILALLPFGFPIAFKVIGLAVTFAAVGQLTGVFDFQLMSALPLRLMDLMNNDLLQAIPLFIYIGAVMERTALSRDLFRSLGAVFGQRPGGLAVATLVIGLLLAPTTGAVGATVVALGLLALPSMLAAGYDRSFAVGMTAAVGTLGTVVPPSILLILLGDQMRIAQTNAANAVGGVVIHQLLFRDIYLGMVVPVVLVILGYGGIIAWRASRHPNSMPPRPMDMPTRGALLNVAPPLAIIIWALFVIVTGRIYTVEAAAAAAVAFTTLALARGELTRRTAEEIARLVMRIVGALFLLITAAQTFSLVFRGFGGDVLTREFLTSTFGSTTVAVPLVFGLLLVFGFFLDAIEIIFLVVPVVTPPLIVLGADPLWLAVLVGVTLQTSFLLPPAGFALFFMDQVRRNVGVEDMTMATIYRGVRPFVLFHVVLLIAVLLVPALATMLPSRL